MDLLANGSGTLTSDLPSVLSAAAAAILGLVTVVVGFRQFRSSAREQGELAKEARDFERLRAEVLARASAEKEEVSAAGAEGRGSTPVDGTSVPHSGTFLPPFRDLPMLADETQYEILRKYHAQGLAQSRASFWFSLAFASLGFIIIATAVLTIDRSASLGQQSAAVISLISGTIIDAVAGLFFVQSSRAQRVMQEFFDKLRTDRKLEESLKLVDKIADPELQGKLQVLLALNFAEVNSSADVLTAVLSYPLQFRRLRPAGTRLLPRSPPQIMTPCVNKTRQGCRASWRRLPNEASGRLGRASPCGRAGDHRRHA
jgi:uncharacterized membrane-anchored protein YhcB (DUF1043 family)